MSALPIIGPGNSIFAWWRDHVIASVDHPRVVEKVRGEAGWSGRYVFMILMSAGIAMLGLLLSSPAVVIGAMLISPLMGPIIGMGFALATFDWREMRASAVALALGTVLAVCFTGLIVLVSPLQNVTEEIAARTRPNLFDLMVALFSALAGAYAMVRGREGTVVGVAIATALMPPLAVVGFGLATMNSTVFFGAGLLFLTNLMTIAVAAAVMARLFGFGQHLSPQHTLLQTVLVLATFVAFAVPLGLSLRQIAWETAATRQTREAIIKQFDGQARLSQLELDYDAQPMRVSATVLTPTVQADGEARAERMLRELLDRPVAVALEQVPVRTGAAAEAAQIAAASADASAAAADRAAQRAMEQLALVAGVAPDAVLLDRDHRRAVVHAASLPGAGLAAYRALEGRVAAAARGWRVELVPPALALPEVTFEEDAPTGAGRAALETAAWAARRLGAPVGVSGSDARVTTVVEALTRAGIRVEAVNGPGGADGAVRLRWLAPDEGAQ